MAYRTIHQSTTVAAHPSQAVFVVRRYLAIAVAGPQTLQKLLFARLVAMADQSLAIQTRLEDFSCQKLVTAFLSVATRTSSVILLQLTS